MQQSRFGVLGRYNLTVNVNLNPPVSAYLLSSNDGNLATGSITQTAAVRVLSPLSWGDQMVMVYRRSDGNNNWSGQLHIPVNARGGEISLGVSASDSRIISRPFEALNIKTREQRYELGLRQPIWRQYSADQQREVALGISINHTRNQGELLGFNFPIIQGADETGLSQSTLLSLTQEYTQRSPNRVLFAQTAFKFGLPIAATINSSSPDGEFIGFAGNVSWQQRLNQKLSLGVRSSFQIVDRPVYSFEQINLTGIDAVRGYPQNSLLRDNGWVLNTELNAKLYAGKGGEIIATPFFDLGVPWSAPQPQIFPNPDPNFLASVGLGLQYRFKEYLSFGVSWGVPLYPIKNLGHSLQEQGFAFSLRCKFP